jgi:hypothetical protein
LIKNHRERESTTNAQEEAEREKLRSATFESQSGAPKLAIDHGLELFK